MDAHGRRHAGDIDPADQWVFNPNTGSYELRLTPAADETPVSYGDGARPTTPRRRRTSSAAGTESDVETTELQVPSQRSPQGGAGGGSGGGRRAANASRRKPKAKLSRKQKVLRWGGGSAALILVAGCGGVYLYLEHLNNNIDKVDVGIDNPAVTDGPANILIIGTDSRTGKGNKGYGDAGSVGHADTTLLLHVSADRSNATALSIPRDMITDIPACPTKQDDGSTKTISAEQGVRFNTSLGQRGRDPGCTWRTVQKMTGVEINHFMMADFNAVKELSAAVGGVEVCVAKDIDDPKSHLKLDAGKHTIKGEQALAFVRTRHSVGFGSDLSRIELQQQFLSAMIRKMKSSNTLTDPGKLFDLAEAATKALTVDSNIGSVKKLIGLGKDLRRVNTDNITFVTAPVVDNPEDKASVVLDESKAAPLFKMLQQDKSLTKTKKDKGGKKDDGGLGKVKPAPASEVRVDITNGGGPVGAAQSTVTWLQNEEGVALSTNAGNASENLSKTRLEYAPNQASQAAALVKMMGLPGSALKKASADAGPEEPMKLTLGKDFTEAGQPIDAPAKTPEGVKEVNAGDKNVCAK
ncbi:LytR family transcriptional regulator [Streptomyces armeniacus]|uniref:LytR family transcriptional regulator n=1 Tax=Streptomyces armeniacus TaxID=83291 RepID=A0A345XQI4_9ACTN|nr:LCP family protein [Streptomyces armeniacus]AXK33900.1 LytR family transcriptional regulator [Streptomyces armeniacus]